MSAQETSEKTPFHLTGNYTPVDEEITARDLPVTGALPAELSGRYFRNGPNPASGPSAHWFLGDGMIHGIRLRDGRAEWYRNRWVRTRALEEPDAQLIDELGNVDRTVGVSNTHVVEHAGRILALVESSFPCEVSPELATLGVHDFDGRLDTAMTAHPKICPVTGEMHFFGYGFAPPYLTYHRVAADGELVQSEVVEVPGPTMIHDFAITDQHVVFMDLPVVFDLDLALQGTMPYRWDDDYGARVGVMGRTAADHRASGDDVRWFEVEPCYVFHPLNAFADGGSVVVDTARYEQLWAGSSATFDTRASLHRWRIDLDAGTVAEEGLDDRPMEFPRVPDDRTGLAHRYGYAVAGTDNEQVIKYDLDTGRSDVHHFGPGRVPGEPVFVPAESAAAEDDGWLLTYVYDRGRDGSDFVVLDARQPAAEPVAVVELPQRVPFGFHGSWLPDPAGG